jgi:excisionase family DNA binding protein
MSKTQKSGKIVPMFKTVEIMAKLSGIGENTLRNLMEAHKLEYIQIGNKRLIAEEAMWAWYQRNKVAANTEAEV